MKLAHYVINKLTPHGMPKIQKISPKFMLTQQTFDTCMFRFPFQVPIEYLLDKWHNQYIDISWCTNTIVQAVYVCVKRINRMNNRLRVIQEQFPQTECIIEYLGA